MRYMLMIHEDENTYANDAEGEAWQAIIRAHTAFVDELRTAGVMVNGLGLQPTATATTLRRTAGSVSTHDGPYAETKEQLGGYYVIDVADLDAALHWARKIPLHGDGSIEVRPAISETS